MSAISCLGDPTNAHAHFCPERRGKEAPTPRSEPTPRSVLHLLFSGLASIYSAQEVSQPSEIRAHHHLSRRGHLLRARWPPPTLKAAMAAKRASQAIGNAHGPKAAARTRTEDSRMTTNRSTMALAIWPDTSRRTGKNEAMTPRRSAPHRPARRCPRTSKRVEIRVEHHRHLREGLRQCPGGGYCADPEVL